MDERPLECSHCKRIANIIYKKLKYGEVESCRMCSMCPKLQANIGLPEKDGLNEGTDLNSTKKCPNCQTTLYELTTQGVVGCPSCYHTFEEFIADELSETGAIPIKSDSSIMKKKSIPIHLGASPEILQSEEKAKKLESLQSALSEAVESEDFERAASLRDQIKTVSEKFYGKERKAS